MKVSVKISPETLVIVQKILLGETHKYTITRDSKFKKSMYTELFEQFSRACLNYSTNPNGKYRTLTIRYHLAESLLELITRFILIGNLGTYELNLLERFKNQIHQKLQ